MPALKLRGGQASPFWRGHFRALPVQALQQLAVASGLQGCRCFIWDGSRWTNREQLKLLSLENRPGGSRGFVQEVERPAAGSQASHLILLCLSFLVSKEGLRTPLTRVAVTPKELRQKTCPPPSASDLGLWVLSGTPLLPQVGENKE